MTAGRVVALVLIVGGIAALSVFNSRRLSRMNAEERRQFDRNIAPVARALKMFMWFWTIAGVAAAVDAAVNGVWPVSIALLVLAVGIGYGMAYNSRWWLGR